MNYTTTAAAFFENAGEAVKNINDVLNGIVWGVPVLVLFIFAGVWFTARSGFFQLLHAGLISKMTFLAIFKNKSVTKTKDGKSITQFQALSTALAASMGTGNIAGVAAAITVGGAGAVFWMWIAAFFGMMTSFAENALGIYYRKKNKSNEWAGGAMYYLENGLAQKRGIRHIAKPLAVLFAVFCTFASFGIGNMAQVNSISGAMLDTFGIPQITTGIILAAVAGLVIIGGIKRIGKFTEKFVPFMAIAYTLGTVIIFCVNISRAPEVFGSIFNSAFGFDAVAGGVSGALVKQAITMGFKRGVFSNEAGLGSTVAVNSSSDVKEPAVQGMWGIFEVFTDTILMCTLTAFAVLSTGVIDLSTGKPLVFDESGAALEGVPLVSEAFTRGFGGFAGVFIALAVLFFAFSTIVGWSFYGTKAVEYLFGAKATIVYKVVFVCFIVVGAVMNLGLAWEISDTMNGLMAIPNLIGVLALSDVVFKLFSNYKERIVAKNSKAPKPEPMLSAYPEIQLEQAEKLYYDEETESLSAKVSVRK